MKKYTMLLTIVALTAAVCALAHIGGRADGIAHAQAGPPSNVRAANGANPGEVIVSWDPVAGSSSYRVGWLAVPDYQANLADHRWLERFTYSDVTASSSFTVTRLTPGTVYYFITGRKQGNDIAWSPWATLNLIGGALPCPSQPAVAPITASALRVANGPRPGEVVISWDVVPETTGYRVGWLAVPDYQANQANNRWLERFAYSDIAGGSSFMVTRLTPGVAYYFILGRKRGNDITWSQWAALALNADVAACQGAELPTSTPTQSFPANPVGGDYDHDNDALIEVRTLAQLNAVRLDLVGSSLVNNADVPEYLRAFPGALDNMGCPASGCKGYELASHLDMDTNGNGRADAGDTYWNDGAGWEPIRDSSALEGYGSTFNGNGYTIANLYINRPGAYYTVGLFGGNAGAIRNVVLSRVDVTGSDHVGALVGRSSTFDFLSETSGNTVSGRVSGNNYVGGLIGSALNNSTIDNNSSSATVSGNNHVGGLVGVNLGAGGAIRNSTASGNVSGNEYVGGLAGENHGNGRIIGSAASGDVTGRFLVGGLVGLFNGGHIENSTASGNVTGIRFLDPLVGRHDAGTITNSFGTGTVTRMQ